MIDLAGAADAFGGDPARCPFVRAVTAADLEGARRIAEPVEPAVLDALVDVAKRSAV